MSESAPLPATGLAAGYRRLGLIIAACVFVADQVIKAIVTGPLDLENVRQIVLLPIFNLSWAQNYGVSFGMFTAESATGRWILVALTGLVAAGVAFWLWREKTKGDVVALALVLGGALGNIVDRIRVGYVIDYTDLHFGGFQPFLVFNVADAAITIGVLLLVARSLLVREKGE